MFPRLVASEHRTKFERRQIAGGVPALDALLGGGVEQGSSTLVLGPAGTGKSTFVLQFIAAAVERGGNSADSHTLADIGVRSDAAATNTLAEWVSRTYAET